MSHSNKKYQHGFKVPEGYFDELEDQISIAQKEASLPKETGYKVPSNYFENFEDKLLTTLHSEENKATVKVIPLYQRNWFKVTTSIAACLLIALFVSLNQKDDITIELAENEVTNYLETDLASIDTDDIAQLLTETELEELDFDNEEVSNTNLEEYLLENLDDTSLLIE